MSNQQSDYDTYLYSVHAKLVTPDEIIQEVVKEGTAHDVFDKKRIIAGEVNEVYDITLTNNNHVILRISRSDYPDFIQEQWAIEKVKKIGVPVPEIILVKHLNIEAEKLSLCLMTKIDGEPLERGGIDFNSLSKEIQKNYIVNEGEILSKIHSIKTQGYGGIRGEGTTEFATSDNIIDDILYRKERMYAIAEKENLDRTRIDKAMTIVEQFRQSYAKTSTYLNHGDYSHKHFMVNDEKIVAILDWGGVRSDTPIHDFAWWDYWFGQDIPTAWLKEGYQNKTLFDNNFEDTLHILRIMKGIEIIDWYSSEKYQKAVKKAIGKLLTDLDYFK